MKLAVKIIFLLGVSCSLMLYSGCSKKHPAPPSITDQQLDLLTKSTTSSWKVTGATKDLVDQMADYPTTGSPAGGVILKLSGTKGQTSMTYTVTGTTTGKKYPWNLTVTGGKFDFDTTAPATTLIRDDGVTVTYAATKTQLTMSFTYNGPGWVAREGVVTGVWLFTFAHP